MIALIVCLAIIAVALIAFLTWFFSMTAEGKCPLCALKAFKRSKLTMDISETPDYENGVSPLPLMGWSSWNTLRNHISEEAIYDCAKVLSQSGLAEAGYKYVNIDDCWQSNIRDENGCLQGDLESFPSGMKALCEKINALGLKMGIYSSNGTLTCEDMPASLGNEEKDAKTFASWGVEYLKYDYCHHEIIKGSTPIIEYVDINRVGESAQIRLRPEHAKYEGRAKCVKCSDLPSKQGIAFLNHGAGSASYEIDVPSGGDFVFTVHYRKNYLHSKQYLQIIVNGKTYELFFPKGMALTHDARAQVLIKLRNGVNLVKLCNPIATRADSIYLQYQKMGNALREASKAWAQYSGCEEKPITYSICEWGFNKPWFWGCKAGNMWRTTFDITPHWLRIVSIYNKNLKLYKYSSPSHINDPDMLEVGNGKLSEEENKSHFALWCMMAAPLVLGNDLRNLTDNSAKSRSLLKILTNKSLILIDQDPLVKSAKKIGKIHGVEILARPLSNGDAAICFFNKSSRIKTVDFSLDLLCDEDYLEFPKCREYQIHDLWSDERLIGDSIKANIVKHGVKVYRISAN
ncbi:MAG: glycoside hydrolase family 27 protein [Eubacterium sp.]|nr:glycoside hydrolase family 27 protein [Eubacterium sp.]